MSKRNKMYWKICVAIAIVLMILSYTPVVIPKGIHNPMVFGVPYSLWFGFLITVAFVVLTFVGAKVHPGSDMEEE